MEPDLNTEESPLSGTRKTAAYRRCAMRMLRTPSQGMVAVYEMDPAAGATEAPSLVFESRSWCLRMNQYPPEWRQLRDDELLKLGSLSD